MLVIGCDPAGGVQVEGAELAGKVPGAEGALRFRAGIGLAQHPHWCALLRWAGGRRAGGRRVKQGRVGGVGFAETFAQDRIHFIIPRSGGEGDEAALFQIAQNALTGPSDNELDILLAGFGCGLEEGRKRRGIRCLWVLRQHIHAVQEQGVEMRVEAQVGGGALNDRDRAGLAAAMMTGIPSSHCVGE